MAQAQVKEREDDKVKELKPGERAPGGEDNPKVGYAAGKIVELLLGLHPDDRALALEHVNKTGLLSGGESKIEKDQKEAAKKRQEESDKWVKEAKLQNKKASKEALEASEAKHKAEVDASKGKAK